MLTTRSARLARSERNSMATLTSIAKLSRKLGMYFDSEFPSPQTLVERLNEKGWKYFLKLVPGFGVASAKKFHEVLLAAGYTLTQPCPK